MDSEGAAEPFVDLPTRTAPALRVLVLHGGKAESRGPVEPRQFTVRRMQPFVRSSISSLGRDLAVGQIRYRYRGRNEAAADPVADVEFALAATGERYGPVPVVLVGYSTGGRAVLEAAGHSRCPRCRRARRPGHQQPAGEQFQVRDALVAGRAMASSTSSRALFVVARAAPVARRTAVVRVPWSGHGMLLRAGLWHHLTAEFVSAIVDDAPFTVRCRLLPAARCIDCTPAGTAGRATG